MKQWKVEVQNQHPTLVVRKEVVVRLLRDGLTSLSSEGISKRANEVGVVFTDDREIRRLNKIYRNKNKPTDVLSFSQLEGEDGLDFEGGSLGDIVISLDTALNQAVKFKVTPEQEVLRLLMHGMLHLLGYDHVDVPKEEGKKMRALEDTLQERFKGAWRKAWILEK
ncbi:MAG: rRNA maturation RNase YbeY [Bdellovibrionota bacterium]|jgi:probable rRNA maturation factor